MATAFSDLKSKVLRVYKRTDKTTELEEAINEAYREMVACLDPHKLQDQIHRPVVAGREEYPIPDTVLRINHPIRLIDPTSGTNNSSESYPLKWLTKDEYDLIEPNPNATTINKGKPWAYTFWKNSILLTDLPDKSTYRLEINIGGEPTILTAASDTTIFAPTWDETIKAGALSRLYALIERWDMADYWQKVYRWGFAGSETNITGGLGLLKKLEETIQKAPLITDYNDF